MSTLTKEAVVEAIKTAVEQIRLDLRGDLDWQPTVFTFGHDDQPTVGVIDPEFLSSAAYKSQLAQALAVFSAHHKARIVCLVMSAWVVNVSVRDTARIKKFLSQGLDDEPDRAEAVIIYAVDSKDDATWMVDVTGRSPDAPPTLGPWRKLPPGSADRYCPHIAAAIRSQLN
jgi:hypothetical protein